MTAAGALITVGVAATLGLIVILFAYFGPGPAARQGAATTVVLRPGAGVPEIASELKRAGVIGSDTFFIVAAEATGAAHKLRAGEYDVVSHASLGAAGAVEAAFSVLALRDQIAPPTINLDNPSVETALDLVPHKAKPMKIDVALSNSFGFGGTNASLVFKKAP